MRDYMDKIKKHNEEYRNGIPSISDEEYDQMLNILKMNILPKEYAVFKRTLTEEKGKVKHEYIIGSLDKLKAEDKSIKNWCVKQNITSILCSYKLDGASFTANFKNGEIISLATRGDGYTGESLLNKAEYIFRDDYNGFTGTIRGELVLENDSHTILNMKNRRNGLVGVIKEDNINPEKLSHVVPYAYQILSSFETIATQLSVLSNYNFNVPEYQIFKNVSRYSDLDELLKVEMFSKTQPYDYDGVVISSDEFLNENEFYPSGQIAYKLNQDAVKAKVLGIEWNISKSGALKPVALIEPTEISGTTVGRCTAYNASYVSEMGIGTNSIITLIRSGEVIPKIIEVIKPCTDVAIPLFCPCCSTSLVWKGVDVVCTNPDCKDATVKQIEHFVKASGIENVSESSLRNWGIFTFNDLLKWTPDTNYKTQNDFWFALEEKVFSQSPVKIMRCFPINGIGTTNYDKLITSYGSLEKLNNIFNSDLVDDTLILPAGIGIRTLGNAYIDWCKFYKVLTQITEDKRFSVQTEQTQNNTEKENTSMKLSGLSFLMTGKLSVPRIQKELIVIDNGGTIASGVSKTLSYLICSSDESASSKYVKATKLGIPIISEEEFDRMVG